MLIAAKAQVDYQDKVRFTAQLSVSYYLDVYRVEGRHCTLPESLLSC